jgi:hypothetical protein
MVHLPLECGLAATPRVPVACCLALDAADAASRGKATAANRLDKPLPIFLFTPVERELNTGNEIPRIGAHVDVS